MIHSVQRREERKLDQARDIFLELTLGKEIWSTPHLLDMGFRLLLQSNLKHGQHLGAFLAHETDKAKLHRDQEITSRIFTSPVLLFLSSFELELLWDREPPDSPKAQRLVLKVFSGYNFSI